MLSYLEEIPLCVQYELQGECTDRFPFPAALDLASPVITTMKGWHCDISGVRSWDDLPEAARKYVEFIEEQIGCHIRYVSVGAQRDEYLVR